VGVSDLTLISKVSNEAINDNLKKRFENREIYVSTLDLPTKQWHIQRRVLQLLTSEQTYIGHVLVSVNPFQDCEWNLLGVISLLTFAFSGNLYRCSSGQL
jgi:myosin-1